MNREARISFQPSGRSVFVLQGTILLEAAARAGFIVETPCGGIGKCGKCVVRVTSGECPASDHDKDALGAEQVARGYRLACRSRADGDLTVEIPESSLFQSAQKILTSDSGEKLDVMPSVSKHYVRLDPIERDDVRSDVERLKKALGPVDIDIHTLRSLPHALRGDGSVVTATVACNRLVGIEPGRNVQPCYGMAFDIGTTTLVGTLVDLGSGVDIAVASMINPQTSFGDDVVSRIKRCREDQGGLEALRKAVLGAVNSIANELGEKAAVDMGDVWEAVFAGNTTMQQILCGINPFSLGQLPFVATFRDAIRLRAMDLGLEINPNADAHVLPQIGGFVGGDTVAGILATRLDQSPAPALLVDIGTNGELVLAHDGKLIATSVAAGPAFEGARIVNGMRATGGAIEKVVIADDVSINVIGNARPMGICGTGLIDAVAALLDLGVIDDTGRILGPDELPASVPDAIRRRIMADDGRFDFILADAAETAAGRHLCLYQKDIRELQLANGAIRAGISILLKMEGMEPSDLGCVLLAGAFGNFIRRKNARRIGMLPQIPNERIRFVGNTASFGAKRFLLSSREKECAARIMRETRHVDLSLNPEFQMEFSSAMIFPS